MYVQKPSQTMSYSISTRVCSCRHQKLLQKVTSVYLQCEHVQYIHIHVCVCLSDTCLYVTCSAQERENNEGDHVETELSLPAASLDMSTLAPTAFIPAASSMRKARFI